MFPNDMFNKQTDVRVPSTSLGTLYVMGAANTIYLRPTLNQIGPIALTLNLNNLENPQYSMPSQTFRIVIQEVISDRLRDKYTFDVIREILPIEGFSTFAITANESAGGCNNVTYKLTI